MDTPEYNPITNTWLACDTQDRYLHEYAPDGLGGWLDLGRWTDPATGLPRPC
jgi:hypothetical protein